MDTALETSLTDIVSASGHVGYHWDLQADLIVWLGSWQRLFGDGRDFPPHNATHFTSFIVAEDRSLVFDDSSTVIDREYRLRLPNGRLTWVHETGVMECDSGGRPRRRRGLIRIIENPQRRHGWTESELQNRDPLTGLPTRVAMLAELDRLLKDNQSLRELSSYMVVSVDKMAFVNEAVGPKIGDTLLCGVVDRLNSLIPVRAKLARVGGDMFGILLVGLGREAEALAQRILQNFRDCQVATPSGAIQVTVSIGGVPLASSTAVDGSEVIIHAEQALREARRRGRDQYLEYKESEVRSKETRTVLELGRYVKQALQQDGLKLAFQPVVDAETGQTMFYEALARLFDADGQMISAAQFIPIVEQQGLASVFDRHVLAMSVREMEAHPTLRLSVNVSGLTAAQSDWLEHVRGVLEPRPHVARRLIMEITETAAIMDVTETRKFAESLRKLGGQVALDDFGAGFTSIRHLRTLALSIMKIDRELILNLIGNPEQEHLVRMLISMARGLGIKTVAEGIETADVAEWLRKEKVDMMQGYFFGKPSLERPWLTERNGAAAEDRARIMLQPPELTAARGPLEIRGTVME